MNDWLSLPDAAELCRVHRNTLVRWIDKGLIVVYQLPGSRHRRIMKSTLREFMVANNIATDLLDAELHEVE